MWIIWLIVGTIVALPVLFILALNIYAWRSFQQEAQTAQARPDYHVDPLLNEIEAGRPALLYFTADWCGSCKTMQTPAIERLQDQHPNLQVLTIDTVERPEVAERWGVMSLPRTFIISADKQVVATNIKTASTEKLAEQLSVAKQNTSQQLDVNMPKFTFRIPTFKLGNPNERPVN